ncbi:MAG: hypothetical protein ABJJ14_05565 [Cyclobacteriaceae bacterium]
MCNRLRKIDELIRSDHYYLEAEDECYYLLEYTAGKGFEYSKANSIITNFKKKMNRQGMPDWKYKAKSIREVSGYLLGVLGTDYLSQVTLMPIPPSKAKSDPNYDDRMLQMLNQMCQGVNTDIRELITLKQTIQASHERADRPSPDELIDCFQIDDSLCHTPVNTILLFDDMITTGSHFKACKRMILDLFPEASVYGIFIARRSIEDDFFGINIGGD